MLIPLLRLVAVAVSETDYEIHSVTARTPTNIKECALTRHLQDAIARKTVALSDFAVVEVVDQNANPLPTVRKLAGVIDDFFRRYPGLHPFLASQHMSEVGKFFVSTFPVKEAITALWDENFAARLDAHKWFKLGQIAAQSGHATKDNLSIATYIDEKRADEDGIIYVNPAIWEDILYFYSSLEDKPFHPATQLIKVNSCESDLTIKALLMRASPSRWAQIGRRSGRTDFDICLCGNAVKDNVGYEIGEVYDLPLSAFAYHTDSSVSRGYTVNVSKQVLSRSGMDVEHFVYNSGTTAFDDLQGCMAFDEGVIIDVLGGLDGDDPTLDSMTALKKRLVLQGIPAAHPVNVPNVFEHGKAIVRQHLAKICVDGFHGMGGPHDGVRGTVGVSRAVYDQWLDANGHPGAYLFRMPYLGSYCGLYVELQPVQTDTILVHPDDALQMDGDFDGDQYYVIPSDLVRNADYGQKPARPLKGTKDELPLGDLTIRALLIEQATNKAGIGPRDSKLCKAYDTLRFHEYAAEGDRKAVEVWEAKVAKLQVYVQQAIEGLKHQSEGQLTDKQADELLYGAKGHVYTSLFGNLALGRSLTLKGNRRKPGYMELVYKAVHGNFNNPKFVQGAWHPLHPIFARMAELTFGEQLDLREYYPAIASQPLRAFRGTAKSKAYAQLRHLKKTYATGLRKWNGGQNRNIGFRTDVLGPVIELWKELLAPYAYYDENDVLMVYPDKVKYVWDLHRMLADVAYEPTPNWALYSQDSSQDSGVSRLGLFVKFQRGLATIRLAPHGSDTPTSIEPDPKETDLSWTDWITTPEGHQVGIMKKLAAKGSLFHHLGDPTFIRDILQSVLPAESVHLPDHVDMVQLLRATQDFALERSA
jgi:hypothetical protein